MLCMKSRCYHACRRVLLPHLTGLTWLRGYMRIAISADSTCDLPRELCEKYQVAISPLSILKDGQSFKDQLEITPAQVIEAAEHGSHITTSAVNVSEYEQLFKSLMSDHDAVIHFSLGAEFSTSYANACVAARPMEQVHVIDTRNLHTGSALPLLRACEMAAEGAELGDILLEVSRIIPRVCAGFLTTDIEYLRKGGRCSSAAAFTARIMGIRPSIDLIDGKMEMGRKYRGSLEHSLKHYLKDRLSDPAADLSRAFVSHTVCDPKALDTFLSLVREYSPFKEIILADAGCVISAHCGPGTFAVFYMRKG